MSILYHFSHFLEFLCGVYFGGFALLTFLQRDAKANFISKLEERIKTAETCKSEVLEYMKIAKDNVQLDSITDVSKFFYEIRAFLKWVVLHYFMKILFRFSNRCIRRNFDKSNKGLILKKFFPSFFYTGCYCLLMILLSAYEQIALFPILFRLIDIFIVTYTFLSLLFLLWALLYFPIRVNKVSYRRLILKALIHWLIVTSLSIILTMVFNKTNCFGYYFIIQSDTLTLITGVIIIAILPLVFIFIYSTIVLALWEYTNTFYVNSLKNFKSKNGLLKADNGVLDEIKNSLPQSTGLQ